MRLSLEESPVTGQVEYIGPITQFGRDPLQGCTAPRSQGANRDACKAGPGSLQLALYVQWGQRLAAWLPISHIFWVGNHYQGRKVRPRTQTYRPPIQAAQVAGEEQVLSDNQMRTILWIAKGLPTQAMQLWCTGTNKDSQAQRQIQGLRRSPSLEEGLPYLGIGKEAICEHLPVRIRVDSNLAETIQVKLDEGWCCPEQSHIRISLRMNETQFNPIVLRVPAMQADLKISIPSHL
jgi:hypothetical protein